jgi:hypothetical protein
MQSANTSHLLSGAEVWSWREQARELISHAFNAYMAHGYPWDEVRPLQCTGRRFDRRERGTLDDVLGGYGLTLIDSLDTLALTGDLPAFRRAVSCVVEDVTFDRDVTVSVFEASIRVMGGLLSAHLLASDPRLGLFDAAVQCGDGRHAAGLGNYTDYETACAAVMCGARTPVCQWGAAHFRAGAAAAFTRGAAAFESAAGRDPGSGSDWSSSFAADLPARLADTGCLLRYEGQLLFMARELARRLLPAFDSPTGLPYHRINLRTGLVDRTSRESCTAAAGTFLFEWGLLSRLTGDPTFEAAARRATAAIWSRRSGPGAGLVGSGIDVEDGFWRTPHTGIGAGVDSYLEYLLKSGLLLDDDALVAAFHRSADSVAALMDVGGIHAEIGLAEGMMTKAPIISSLQAFYPGLEVLAGSVAEARTHIAPLLALWYKYRALPEAYDVAAGQPIHFAKDAPLRPELIESNYHLYTATRDPAYLWHAYNMMHALANLTRVPCGFASIADVSYPAGAAPRLDDRMDSYFIAETLKYLFLTFDHALWHWGEGPTLGPSWGGANVTDANDAAATAASAHTQQADLPAQLALSVGPACREAHLEVHLQGAAATEPSDAWRGQARTLVGRHGVRDPEWWMAAAASSTAAVVRSAEALVAESRVDISAAGAEAASPSWVSAWSGPPTPQWLESCTSSIGAVWIVGTHPKDDSIGMTEGITACNTAVNSSDHEALSICSEAVDAMDSFESAANSTSVGQNTTHSGPRLPQGPAAAAAYLACRHRQLHPRAHPLAYLSSGPVSLLVPHAKADKEKKKNDKLTGLMTLVRQLGGLLPASLMGGVGRAAGDDAMDGLSSSPLRSFATTGATISSLQLEDRDLLFSTEGHMISLSHPEWLHAKQKVESAQREWVLGSASSGGFVTPNDSPNEAAPAHDVFNHASGKAPSLPRRTRPTGGNRRKSTLTPGKNPAKYISKRKTTPGQYSPLLSDEDERPFQPPRRTLSSEPASSTASQLAKTRTHAVLDSSACDLFIHRGVISPADELFNLARPHKGAREPRAFLWQYGSPLIPSPAIQTMQHSSFDTMSSDHTIPAQYPPWQTLGSHWPFAASLSTEQKDKLADDAISLWYRTDPNFRLTKTTAKNETFTSTNLSRCVIGKLSEAVKFATHGSETHTLGVIAFPSGSHPVSPYALFPLPMPHDPLPLVGSRDLVPYREDGPTIGLGPTLSTSFDEMVAPAIRHAVIEFTRGMVSFQLSVNPPPLPVGGVSHDIANSLRTLTEQLEAHKGDGQGVRPVIEKLIQSLQSTGTLLSAAAAEAVDAARASAAHASAAHRNSPDVHASFVQDVPVLPEDPANEVRLRSEFVVMHEDHLTMLEEEKSVWAQGLSGGEFVVFATIRMHGRSLALSVPLDPGRAEWHVFSQFPDGASPLFSPQLMALALAQGPSLSLAATGRLIGFKISCKDTLSSCSVIIHTSPYSVPARLKLVSTIADCTPSMTQSCTESIDFLAHTAHFGPLLTRKGLSGHRFALASPLDACSEQVKLHEDGARLTPDGPRQGRRVRQGIVAVVLRGSCSFVSKVRAAQKAGASAVVVLDVQENGPDSQVAESDEFAMADDGTSHDIRIPAVFISPSRARSLVEAMGIAGSECAIARSRMKSTSLGTEADGSVRSSCDMTVLAAVNAQEPHMLMPWTKHLIPGAQVPFLTISLSIDFPAVDTPEEEPYKVDGPVHIIKQIFSAIVQATHPQGGD